MRDLLADTLSRVMSAEVELVESTKVGPAG
jgi:hypothetical protein